MKKGMLKKTEKILFYIVLLILILLIILILADNAFNNYHSFRGHQNYFKNKSNEKIQQWMTPYTIIRQFGIDKGRLFQELNTSENIASLRTPIYKICENRRLNCSEVIDKLNSLVE